MLVRTLYFSLLCLTSHMWISSRKYAAMYLLRIVNFFFKFKIKQSTVPYGTIQQDTTFYLQKRTLNYNNVSSMFYVRTDVFNGILITSIIFIFVLSREKRMLVTI